MPPESGFVKINTNASVVSVLGTGLEGVAIDAHGLAVWCFAETTEGEVDVEMAEALATLRACRLAVELHVQNLILEMDSQILYKALMFPKPNISFFLHDFS
ncbi:hypothetical protein ACS0TY_013932 [Phlomoides rotata]